MRRTLTLLACALAGLVSAGPVLGGPTFGISDNHPVGAPDDGAEFYSMMNDVGLTENRLTVTWNPATPLEIEAADPMNRSIHEAKLHGISTVLSITQERPGFLSGAPGAADQFATFVQLVVNTFPEVSKIVVGNEFNQPRFYQPQFSSNCKGVSGAAYMRVLAKAYDAAHAANPDITVVTSVSPRGNDNCRARNNRSTSPVRFIRGMGVAYRAMHRNRPAFDEFGIHLYPNQSTDPLSRGYQWPKIGAVNLDRLKQTLWDAFNGTAQPVPDSQPSLFGFGSTVAALQPTKIWIGEIGWQVAVKKGPGSPYHGRESVQTTTEANQAKIYADLIKMMSCDSLVSGMLFFGLIDETDLDRFQAALIRADGTRRPSYGSVKQAIARAQNGCQATPARWSHTESVIGAGVNFGKLNVQSLKQTWWGFTATAKEDATYVAGIYSVDGRQLSESGRNAILKSLNGKGGAKPKMSAKNTINAYWSPIVRFPSRTLTRGNYVYGIRIAAAMNPNRTKVFVSRPFHVGK